MCIEAEAHRTTEFKVKSTSTSSRCEINTSFVRLVRNGHVFFEFLVKRSLLSDALLFTSHLCLASGKQVDIDLELSN